MKELIRNILKEETEGSDPNTKGIDLAIKLLKKSYPYIIGWEINDQRTFTIYLNIICDIEKLKEFYNIPWSECRKNIFHDSVTWNRIKEFLIPLKNLPHQEIVEFFLEKS